jgi:hypothetical protein
MPLKINLHRFLKYTCNNKYSLKDINRHISKIDTTPGLGPNGDCWEWTGSLNTSKYGSFSFNKNKKESTLLAHRVAWELFYGVIILKGILVLHHCDNTKCCNPFHLFLGTALDNSNDKINKGRHHWHKIYSENMWILAKEIRILYNTNKYTQRQLADKFNINIGNICLIVNNKMLYDPYYNKTYLYNGGAKKGCWGKVK